MRGCTGHLRQAAWDPGCGQGTATRHCVSSWLRATAPIVWPAAQARLLMDLHQQCQGRGGGPGIKPHPVPQIRRKAGWKALPAAVTGSVDRQCSQAVRRSNPSSHLPGPDPGPQPLLSLLPGEYLNFSVGTVVHPSWLGHSLHSHSPPQAGPSRLC